MPADNDYKPSSRVKQAAFNSSGGIYNPPATGRDCLHNTALVEKKIMGFFHYKLPQKLTQPCLDASQGVTNLNNFLCGCNLLFLKAGEGLRKLSQGPCSLSGGGCSWHSLASSSWDAPLQWDHSEGFILPSC